MTFTRTKEGIENQRFFYGVDVTVYCEGYADGDGATTLDELYWSSVFKKAGMRCICKSVGGKSNVLDVLQKIRDQKIQSALVAIDSDYDRFFLQYQDDPYVLNTYGYSWESDVLQRIDFWKLINLFAPIVDASHLEGRFNEFIGSRHRNLKRVCAIDIKYYGCGTALFDRRKPQSIIMISEDNLPNVDSSKILSSAKRIHNFQSTIINAESYQSLDGFVHFFGKTILALIYRWCVSVTKLLRKNNNVNLSMFKTILITDFNINSKDDKLKEHYETNIEKVKNAATASE